MKKLLGLLIFTFSWCSFWAQQGDKQEQEQDTLVFEYSKNSDQFQFKPLEFSNIDGFQTYRPICRRHLPWARGGNLGQVMHPLLFDFNSWSVESNLGAYQALLLTHDSIQYYRMSRPFTLLSYANGSQAEQFFQAFHSQNVGEGLNISFRYDRITSEGFFLRELTDHTRFHATYHLHSRNKRFQSKGYFFINNIKAQENGGIVLSSNDNPDDNTDLFDVNLLNAQNRMRSQGVYFDQKYAIWQGKDSINRLSVGYEIKWTKAYRNFSEVLSEDEQDRYENFYLDDNESADTSYTAILRNTFYLQALDNRFKVSYGLENQHYFQNFLTNLDLESHFVGAMFQDSILGSAIQASLEKGLSGFRKDEVDFYSQISLPKWKSLLVKGFFSLKTKQIDYFLWRQRSNHFFYERDWEITKEQLIGGAIHEEKSKMTFKLKLRNLQDYVYFDTLSLPQQSADQIQLIQVELEKQFHFLKHFNLFNRLAYQVISEESLIPLPDLFSYHSFYYENDFFKQSLDFQFGVDFYWVSEYQGYAYNPAIAQFHLNPNADPLGNIQQLDIFLNLGLSKAARIMFKYENILLPSFSEESYRIQDYPIPGRAMKIGLSWRMIN